MGFRLFGVNVEVQFGFWIMSFFLGWRGTSAPKADVLIWMAVVFISILVHEYGHAFAIKRHKIEPEITLHWMGGTTAWRPTLPLGRKDRIIISLAGPFAGFLFAGLIYAGVRLAPASVLQAIPPLGEVAIAQLLYANFYWGLVNLAPVLPFDGGHVLEEALGPKRARMTAGVSFLIGMLLAFYFITRPDRNTWGAMIFGFAAIQSYLRFRAAAAPVQVVRPARPAPPSEDALPAEIGQALRGAREALADERFDAAIALAQGVLAAGADTPQRAAHAAHSVIAWAHLLAGRVGEAHQALEAARKLGEPDPALVGAVAHARGETKDARRVLEAARSAGDDRKEVVGPLIQILIEQGEVARAAAVAYDIVESLSEEDARKMAAIAFDGRAFSESARLYEAVFQRQGQADDAYEAARAHAQAGAHDKAVELLRRAVAAGFSDRARAWSDAALEALRTGDHLEAVLPRP